MPCTPTGSPDMDQHMRSPLHSLGPHRTDFFAPPTLPRRTNFDTDSARILHEFCPNFSDVLVIFRNLHEKRGAFFRNDRKKTICKMHFSCTALAVGEAQRAPHRHRHCEAMQTNETSCECVALAWKGQGALSLRPILQTQMAPDTPRALLARRHLSPSLGTPPRHLFCFRRLARRSP